ncbi:MAG: trypsin-like peptidase domain-containing protein [Parcubacteria group bacterium]|nr:trypsin-like peptidase domain-containing protein [Parcubacteria group bacterium]
MLSEEKTIIDAVKKISPSVISVIISKHLPKVKKIALSPFGQFQFPGLEKPETEKNGKGQEQSVQIGGGSGFVVHSNKDYSLVLTNKHVVHDRDAQYSVLVGDPSTSLGADKECPAEVLSSDPLNDIAILKIKIPSLPEAPLGNSSKIEIGQTAIAIGTALGMFTNSVSKGIISGLSRRIAASLGQGEETEVLRGAIQTDVAINQGNSGGPLINTEGEVVGINTAIIFGAQNIGFALPINWAKKDLEDILKYGRIERPYLGLRYVMLNKKLKEQYGLNAEAGALVISDHLPNSKAVMPGSPADKAGVKENDLITEVNGKKLDEKSELADLIQECKIGDEMELALLRNGKETVKTKVKLEEMK